MEIKLGQGQMDVDQTRRETCMENTDILPQPDGEVPLEQPNIGCLKGWRPGRLQELSRAECGEERKDSGDWSYR